jgi:hypothetical protein
MAAGREVDKFFPVLFSRGPRGTPISQVLAQQGFVHEGSVIVQVDLSILDFNLVVC